MESEASGKTTVNPSSPVSNAQVVMIDDHETTAQGVGHSILKAGVANHFKWFPCFAEAVIALRSAPPCVVVLDLRLPDETGPAEHIPALTAMGHQVVIFTSGDNPYLIRQAIKGGALSVVRKSAPTNDLIEAIVAAQKGEVRANIDWASALDQDEDFVTNYLNPVEADVLALYASGQCASQVAKAIPVALHTVTTYISRIRGKYLQAGRPAPSRVDLYVRAVEDGLIPPVGR
ncbi:MAG: response regulator [Buchananella hordeovulneris]|nr:response regulator [Buchananella hordeovulneris]